MLFLSYIMRFVCCMVYTARGKRSVIVLFKVVVRIAELKKTQSAENLLS